MENAILSSRYDLAVQIWKKYALYVTSNPKIIINTLVTQMEESLNAFEYKAYLLIQFWLYVD